MNNTVTKNLPDSIPHPQPPLKLFAIALAFATTYIIWLLEHFARGTN